MFHMKMTVAVVVGLVALLSVADEAVKVEKTMSVSRCQAVLKDGSQCRHQAESGRDFCWRHRGAAKAIREKWAEASEGANRAWKSTKTWSTNAWESTKTGANRAWKSTQEAFEEAGEEISKALKAGCKAEKEDKK